MCEMPVPPVIPDVVAIITFALSIMQSRFK
jgi:hypothetical protein